jgi:hypothetical protein
VTTLHPYFALGLVSTSETGVVASRKAGHIAFTSACTTCTRLVGRCSILLLGEMNYSEEILCSNIWRDSTSTNYTFFRWALLIFGRHKCGWKVVNPQSWPHEIALEGELSVAIIEGEVLALWPESVSDTQGRWMWDMCLVCTVSKNVSMSETETGVVLSMRPHRHEPRNTPLTVLGKWGVK